LALSEDDRKEMVGLLAEAFSEGIKKFRSDEEEAAAKNDVKNSKEDKAGKSDSGNSGSGFSLAGFLLGERATS